MWDVLKLRKRVQELEEQMLKLTRVIETRDLDWVDMRARCKRLLDRTEKAAARLETEAPPEGEREPGANQPEGAFLTPRQTLAQRLILQRRRANGVLPPTG